MTVKASVTERFSQSLRNVHLNMYRSFLDFCHKLKWESFFLLKWKISELITKTTLSIFITTYSCKWYSS